MLVEANYTTCLVDTGAMVPTVSQSFYRTHLNHIIMEPLSSLVVFGPGDHELPYLGFVVVNISVKDLVNDIDVPLLVVKDTRYNTRVPLVVGNNVVECMLESSKSPGNLATRALRTEGHSHSIGVVQSTKVMDIPAGQTVVLNGLCRVMDPGSDHVMFESGDTRLPGSVLAMPEVLDLSGPGSIRRVKIHVQNFGSSVVHIPAKASLGRLYRVDEVHSMQNTVSQDEVMGNVHSSTVAQVTSNGIDRETFLRLFKFDEMNDLNQVQLHELQDLLVEFHDVFSLDDFDLGKTSLVKHQINLTDETPIKIRHRRVPPSMFDAVRQHLKDMLACGVIRPSKSPWSFPTVLVRKKDGSLRFCLDFRALNNKTIRDSYQLPRIDESMDALVGSKWFSTMDLKSGYWQVDMEESHKERTAFSVGSLGFWECNTMPFGLTNAPSTFQRVLEQCMGDLHLKKCLLYIDDIVVFSKTVSEHFSHIREVLSRLRLGGMKLKPSKCHLLKRSVKYLGHVISEEGVHTDPDKLEAVSKWKVPESVDDVRRFIGFTGFYRRYIENYAAIAQPLTNCLVGDEKSGKHKKPHRKKNNIVPKTFQ